MSAVQLSEREVIVLRLALERLAVLEREDILGALLKTVGYTILPSERLVAMVRKLFPS